MAHHEEKIGRNLSWRHANDMGMGQNLSYHMNPYMNPYMIPYGCRINLANSCKFHLITVITMGVSKKCWCIFFRARSPLGTRVLWNCTAKASPSASCRLLAIWSWKGLLLEPLQRRSTCPRCTQTRRVGTWSVHGLGAHSCDCACMKIIDLTASVLLEFTR